MQLKHSRLNFQQRRRKVLYNLRKFLNNMLVEK